MITKKVMIEFANPRIKVKDHLSDINKAIDHAKFNLYCRHHIRLNLLTISQIDKVVIEMEIPEEAIENFSIGNHLRGISKYLLKEYGNYYKNFTMGKRLFYYIEL